MSSRILLISQNRCDQPYPVFPLGLAHLEAALHRAGHLTCVYDCQASSEPTEKIVTGFCPDVVGISLRNIDDVQFVTRETYFGDTIAFCKTIRRTWSGPVVLGGSGFSIFPEQLLRLTEADYGIYGAGEVSFDRLINALASGADPSDIPGLVHRRGGKIVVNPRAPVEPALLGPAERSQELVDFYVKHSSMLNISTQRGCNLPCCFCTYPLIEGRENRRRQPEARPKTPLLPPSCLGHHAPLCFAPKP